MTNRHGAVMGQEQHNNGQRLTPEAAVDRLEELYAKASAARVRALDRYLDTGEPPSEKERLAFRYPLLRVINYGIDPPPRTRRAYAKFQRPGVYETTITHPSYFRNYLLEQHRPLVAAHGPDIEGGGSTQERPVPYTSEAVDQIGRTGRPA